MDRGVGRRNSLFIFDKVPQRLHQGAGAKAEEKDFKVLLLASEDVMKVLSQKELDELFDPKRSLKHIEYIFEHVGIR